MRSMRGPRRRVGFAEFIIGPAEGRTWLYPSYGFTGRGTIALYQS
jgi:hypothetical protein